MANSLMLARTVELLGGGIASTMPQCAGAVFRLGRAYDLGNPQYVVDLLTSLMGDGSRPVGTRTDNRTITMPVVIQVPNTGNLAADRLVLAGAREMLLQLIAAEEFPLVWGPDGQSGALNLVWECFRAAAATVTHDLIQNAQRISELVITFDALPFGRSDTLATLTFENPVSGQVAVPVPVTIDDYSAVSSTSNAALWSQSPVTALFANSARWHHELSDGNTGLNYTHTLGAAVDLSQMAKVTFWLGLGADAGRYRYWPRNQPAWVAVYLTDNLGRTISAGVWVAANASEDQEWPKWNQVTVPIPQGRTFNYANVTGYQITAWSEWHWWTRTYELDATGYLSGLRAVPATSPKRPASNRGGTYVLYGVLGSAPTQLSLHCQLGTLEQIASTTTVILPGQPGTTNTYTAPAENANWLSTDTATFEGSIGSWTGADGAASNATLAQSSTQKRTGAFALRLTATAAGTMVARSATVAQAASTGLPVSPGDRVAVRAYLRAGATSRTVQVGAEFFNSGGTSLGIVYGPSGADSTSAFTTYDGRVTAPASSAYALLAAQVQSAALSEIHYLDDAYLAYAVQATVVCRGGGAGGGSTFGTKQNAAGGAGAGEIAWETALDLTPGGAHSYSPGAAGQPVPATSTSGNGTDAGDSWFQGTTVQVRGHGGQAGRGAWNPYTSGPGGLGGTGSANSHHFDGGAGSTGDYTQWEGGGGGGSAGDGGAGGAAGAGGQNRPGPGGAAGSLGLAGAQGASGYGGQATGVGWGGDAAQGGANYPGSGGAGSASDTRSHLGSPGSPGYVRLTIKTYTTRAQFPVLLVHRPSPRSTILAKPVINVGDANDPPDGRQYTIPLVDGQYARYHGTYTVLLVAWSWNGTSARTVTVNIRQYDSGGGASTLTSVSASITPGQVVNGMVVLGEITLPVKEIPPDNTDSYFTVGVVSGNSSDRFLDVILLDSQGQQVLVNVPSGGGYVNYYVDAPEPAADFGRVLGSIAGRSQAVSVLANTLASGGPLRLEPGDNLLTVYSPSGQPSTEGDYWPRWYHDRLA